MKERQQDPLELFQSNAPETAAAFDQLIRSLNMQDGLDAKTMQLIYIGIKASQQDVKAVSSHVYVAKKFGASRKEIENTIYLTLTACGVSGITHCLVPALEAYDA